MIHHQKMARCSRGVLTIFSLCVAAAAMTEAGCQTIASPAHEATPHVRPDGNLELVFAPQNQETHAGSPVLTTSFTAPPNRPGIPPGEIAIPAPRQRFVESIDQPVPDTTIDLGAALLLAGVDNPTINLAREQVQESLARQLAARSLLIPNLNVGGNLRVHRGAFQDDPGFLRRPNLQAMFLGAGAGAIGAGTLAYPGVWLFTPLADAAYEPLVASRRVAAREANAQAVQNAILLDVATAYLALVGAEARLDVLRQAESDVAEIVRVTGAFAEAGEGAPADANRASANAEMVRRQARGAEGEIAAAAAQLARLLALDPSVRLRSSGGTVQQFRIVDEDAALETMVAGAVQSRPELAARSAAIQEAEARARQERARPWLPLLSVGYSAGGMGGGSNLVATDFGPLKGRSDLNVIAVWTAQNLGVGNHARIRAADAVVAESVAEYDAVLNQVRREVAEAQAAAKTAARQIDAAWRSLDAAEEGYRLEVDRIRRGQGRPIEALDSFRQLVDARLELLRAVVAFDVAQFQLWVALGMNPAAGPTLCKPPAAPGPPGICY